MLAHTTRLAAFTEEITWLTFEGWVGQSLGWS
jgi:hypothetical protein